MTRGYILRQFADRLRAEMQLVWARRPRRVPFVQQLSKSECGVACLSMVLRYYGKTVSTLELREAAASARDATNAQQLIDTARLYGLRGRAVAVDIDGLPLLPRAAVLHWEFSHFVVFERLRRESIDVVDPAKGRHRVPLERFNRSFTGVALLFEPDESFNPTRQRRSVVGRYFGYILSEKALLPHILVTSLLLQGFGLALPFLNRVLIDRIIPHRDYSLLLVVTIGLACLVLIQTWTSVVRGYFLLFLRTRLDSRMTLGFLEHLLQLPYDFFQRRTTGDLLMRLGSNATVREILTSSVLSAALDGSLALGYLGVLLFLNIPIAVITLTLASARLTLFLITRHRQRQLLIQGIDAQAKSQSFLVETLSGIEAIKSMGLEDPFAQRWSTLFVNQLNVSLQQGRFNVISGAAGGVLATASSMTLLGVAALQVLKGHMSLGDMMALIAIAQGFLTPVLSLAANATSLQQLTLYLERLNDVLDTSTERDRSCPPHIAQPLRGAIAIDRVSFKYGPVSPFVIHDISLQIRPGEFVAIVGRSGSGKSTLARIIVGLYVPSTGRVCFDGIDLAQLDLRTVRRQLGVVTQHSQLFAGTIRSNIALGNPAAPFDIVRDVARRAHIHDDIESMPLGYNTILSDRGSSLSAGQQQRVCLARALLNNPRILLLDEATSHLDAATERTLQDELASLDCTRIVIAHRLSTIMRADRIVVMDSGRIIEQGTHDYLIADGGVYRGLVGAQITPSSSVSP